MAGVRVEWDTATIGRLRADKASLAEAETLVVALRELGFEPELSEVPGPEAGHTAQ